MARASSGQLRPAERRGDGLGGALSHRVSARDTVAGNYAYSSYIYLNNLSSGIPAPNFVSQTASMSYSHLVTPKFGLSIAAGPEWINLVNQPQTLNAFVDASANYNGEFSHLSAAFVRSTNSGYGVIGGAISDSVTFAAGRVFMRRCGTARSTWATRRPTACLPRAFRLTSFTPSSRVCRFRVPWRAAFPSTPATRWKTSPMRAPLRRPIYSTGSPR